MRKNCVTDLCVKELCGKSCVCVCDQAVCERLGVTKLCARACLKDCV